MPDCRATVNLGSHASLNMGTPIRIRVETPTARVAESAEHTRDVTAGNTDDLGLEHGSGLPGDTTARGPGTTVSWDDKDSGGATRGSRPGHGTGAAT
ncbi:hypothetical protein GCM10010349_21160 [Streptomyces flavofungini]|nr:hypothetical protein GCM10010349_21160 [Streptomyces flavofungini]